MHSTVHLSMFNAICADSSAQITIVPRPTLPKMKTSLIKIDIKIAALLLILRNTIPIYMPGCSVTSSAYKIIKDEINYIKDFVENKRFLKYFPTVQ